VPQSTRSDERLAERASAGDERALGAIFKRYHQDLFRYCAALLGNAEDAGDALQNTMVKVLGALPGERRRLHLKPWLYRIAHNESIELLRRRRDFEAIDPEALAATEGPEASAETRERLRRLLIDLHELPERQRGCLVMRELGGLSFEQIGVAFETSAAVARQTVYEARIGLQEMERGRAMECDEVRRKLSDGDRRTFRRRDVRAHLRACRGCQEFEHGISRRQADLVAISPLPALAAAGLLKGIVGGSVASAGGTAATAGVFGGAVSASATAKAVATVVVAGTIAVGAADQAGLVGVFPGGGGGEASTSADPNPSVPVEPGPGHAAGREAREGASTGAGQGASQASAGGGEQSAQHADHAPAGAGNADPSRSHSHRSSGAAGSGHEKSAAGAGSANAHGANPHANGGGRGQSPGKSQGEVRSGAAGSNGQGKAPVGVPEVEVPQPKVSQLPPPAAQQPPVPTHSQPGGPVEPGPSVEPGKPGA
jgi:RNA polymerase sigma factor (sigma-70 family)